MRFNRYSVPHTNSPRFQDELVAMLNDLSSNLAALFDRGIGLTDNLDAVVITFTSNAIANTEDTIAHTLRRIPIGYIVTSLDKAAIVYSGGTAFTSSNIFLKTNTASVNVKALVF